MWEKIKAGWKWIVAGVAVIGAAIFGVLLESLKNANKERAEAIQAATQAQNQAKAVGEVMAERDTNHKELQDEEKKLADTPDSALVDRANKLF